jgi:hypothetical protein
VAVRNATKLDPKEGWQEEWVRSDSGEAYAVGKYLPLGGPSVEAVAKVDRAFRPAAAGRAAARVSDPIPVSPGDYPYRPTIRALIQRDYDCDVAAVQFAAADGGGLLWAVSITADGPLASGQLTIDLLINSARGGGLVHADGRPLDAAVVAEDLRAAFVVGNGLAILNDHPLFPDGTRYIVDADTDYGFEASAGLSGVAPSVGSRVGSETPLCLEVT